MARENATIDFEVTDTGIGISEDKHEAILKLYQANSDTTRKFGGTGLRASQLRGHFLGARQPDKSKSTQARINIYFSLTFPISKSNPLKLYNIAPSYARPFKKYKYYCRRQ